MIVREDSGDSHRQAVAHLRFTQPGNAKAAEGSAVHETMAFKPETAEAMGAAFDSAWRSLQMQKSPLALDAEWAREELALRIIDTARHGVSDSGHLCDDALAHLADAAARRCNGG